MKTIRGLMGLGLFLAPGRLNIFEIYLDKKAGVLPKILKHTIED